MRIDIGGGLAYPQKPHHCKSSFDWIIFVEKWSCKLTHRPTRRAVLEMFADFATCFRIKNVKVSEKVEQKLFTIKKTGQNKAQRVLGDLKMSKLRKIFPKLKLPWCFGATRDSQVWKFSALRKRYEISLLCCVHKIVVKDSKTFSSRYDMTPSV